MQITNDKVQLFEDQPIRTAWVEDEEEWYFSVVDVVGILTEQPDIDGARTFNGDQRDPYHYEHLLRTY